MIARRPASIRDQVSWSMVQLFEARRVALPFLDFIYDSFKNSLDLPSTLKTVQILRRFTTMYNQDYSIMFTIESGIVLIPLAIIGLITLLVWSFRKQRVKAAQTILLLSFGIYLLGVLHFVFFPIDVNLGKYANQIQWWRTINFIPILTIDLYSFVLNIVMFLPFGCYLPFLKPSITKKEVLKLGFQFSLILELTQLLVRTTLGSGRSTDVNDLLANAIGALLGFLLVRFIVQYAPFRRLYQNFQL
jgi:glycopeptide antibiotics resistance protein